MKKQLKKLHLGKRTILNLDHSEMGNQVGGLIGDFTNTTCTSRYQTLCCYTRTCATQNCATQHGQATCYAHGHTCR